LLQQQHRRSQKQEYSADQVSPQGGGKPSNKWSFATGSADTTLRYRVEMTVPTAATIRRSSLLSGRPERSRR
jgi:hypothetical protein